MSTRSREIRVAGLPVQIVRKQIRNLHLGVYPPNGRVRVAVPARVTDQAVRLAVISRLGWIKRQRARFEEQPRQARREMVSGESHYYLGRRYRLRVVFRPGRAHVAPRGRTMLEVQVPKGAGPEQRERVLLRWYRSRLRDLIPPLLEKWTRTLGVSVPAWRIKRMKTRWGSCSAESRRIWVNLELAKKPAQCLEYIVVHELCHLFERRHTDRFTALMDEHLPRWRSYRQELNSTPLAHESWVY
jgi:hypothetical protein